MERRIEETKKHRRNILPGLIALLAFFSLSSSFAQSDSAGMSMSIDMTAEELINKHLQALGGVMKLAAITDETMEAEMSIIYESHTVECELVVIMKLPNKSYSHTTMNISDMQIDNEIWCDGTHCSVRASAGEKTEEKDMTGDKLAAALEGNQFNEPLRYKALGFTPRIKEKKLVDGKPVYILEMKRNHGVGLYGISADTFLMTGMEQSKETPRSTKMTFVRYSDFRPVDGILFPFKMVYETGKATVETRVNRYKLNTNVSDGVFVKK